MDHVAHSGSYKDTVLTDANVALLGHGFPQVSAPIGIRDVTGLHNNLFGTQADWGAVDVPFRREVAADFSNYAGISSTPTASVTIDNTGVVTVTVGSTNSTFDLSADVTAAAGTNIIDTVSINHATGVVTINFVQPALPDPQIPAATLDLLDLNLAYQTALDGQVTLQGGVLYLHDNVGHAIAAQTQVLDYAQAGSIFDYMPRIISRTITTAGVNLLQDGNGHYVEWDHVLMRRTRRRLGLQGPRLTVQVLIPLPILPELTSSWSMARRSLRLSIPKSPCSTTMALHWSGKADAVGLAQTYTVALGRFSSQQLGGLTDCTGGSLQEGETIYYRHLALTSHCHIGQTYQPDVLGYKQLIDAM